MGEIIDRVCPACGKTYKADAQRLKHGRMTTCSARCSYTFRGMSLQTKQAANCARCGKAFEVAPSRLESGKGVYCSRKCFAPPVIAACQNCGKEFRSPPSTHQRFCSRDCANSSEEKSAQSRKSTIEQWRDPDKRQSTLDGIKRRSESEQWRSAPHFQRGPNHPRYRGNAQARDGESRYEYKKWHKWVLQQCGYTCQRCGKVGGRLEAHHVKPWADHPELRYEVSNGMALCEDCHLAIHDHYRKPVTKACARCGQAFRPSKRAQRFCGRACFASWWKGPKA